MAIPQWLKRVLNEEDIAAIDQSIAAAEKHTTGEIVPIVVCRSAATGHVPLLIAALLIILLLLVHIAILEVWHIRLSTWWLLVPSVLIFPLALWLSRSFICQRWFSIHQDVEHQVELRAQLEFREAKVASTRARTGILLFVSLAEHKAVVLADDAIVAKLPPETWLGVLELMIDGSKKGNMQQGLSAAITKCGEILALHFPAAPDDINELPDALIFKE